MIITKTISLWLYLYTVSILNAFVSADSSEDFLKAVIARLKEEKYIDDYDNPFEDIFGETRRSVDRYRTEETQDSLDNTLDAQNNGNFNQNDPLQQIKNELANTGLYTEANLKQPWDNLQYNANPYNVNGVQTLPQDPNLSAQNLEAYAAGINALGPINPDVLPQYNYNTGIADQLQLQNNGQILGNEVAQNNDPLVPMNYYYNPNDNSIDDQLLDQAINAMKMPYGDNLSEPSKKFVVEPLFVAMAGFVGIAMIFMSAVLFLPKFVTPHPTVNGLRGPQELAALTKLAVEAIEGNDCTERIACEVGRAMRSMQVGSQPIKMIEVILPASMAKQLAQIRKAVATKQSCKLIQCKRIGTSELKNNNGKLSAPESKTSNNSKTGIPEIKSNNNKKGNSELKNNTNSNKKQDKPEPKKS